MTVCCINAGFPSGSDDVSAVKVVADGSLHLGPAAAATAPSAYPLIPSSDPLGSGSPGGLPAALPAQPQPWQQEAPLRASASSPGSRPGFPLGPGEGAAAAALAAFAARRQVGALVADWDLEAGGQVGALAANMYASTGADAHALVTQVKLPVHSDCIISPMQVLVHMRPDRLVVTYRNMSALGAAVDAPRSTFQAELFTAAGHFQPAGAVRLTWLAVGAPAGVIGVSAGAGAAPASAFDFAAAVRTCSVAS